MGAGFINKRLTHLSTLDTITSLYHSLEGEGCHELRALVESVQYQVAVVEQLEERGIRSKGIKIHTDKRARLQLASSLFEQGKVLFPDDKSMTRNRRS